MALMDDLIEYMTFCDDLVTEMQATKSSEYKQGVADGLAQALEMLYPYLEDYPEFVDPRHKYDKFKM